MQLQLTPEEIAVIDRQDPTKEKDGGWQGLFVRLQRGIDRSTGIITISAADLARLPGYVKPEPGGWEDRLMAAFGRTLGPKLDGNP